MEIDSHLVSFEGIEGAGKGTQIKLFEEWLRSQGYTPHVLREPGGTANGEQVRKLLLNPPSPLSPLSEVYLFIASRIELLSQKVIPLLKISKNVVILDRYLDSTIAYQGFGRSLGMETIESLHRVSPLDIRPAITFYLHISCEVSRNRVQQRGEATDYFESQDDSYFEKVYLGYQQLAVKYPERIQSIDAQKDTQQVFNQIKKAWENYVRR